PRPRFSGGASRVPAGPAERVSAPPRRGRHAPLPAPPPWNGRVHGGPLPPVFGSGYNSTVIKIAPSILSADFAALGHDIARVGAGAALNPSTPPDALEYVLDDLDLVLVMSVNPGFGGQTFIPSTRRKIRDTRALLGDRRVDVSVDGGVKADLAKSLADDGASTLV